MTACSDVTVTGRLLKGGPAVDTNEASDAGSSNCEVASELSTNLVKVARAAEPGPSSLLSSTRVARPAALSLGSGRSTRSPIDAGGPPSAGGSSTFQPAGGLKAWVSLATRRGITTIRGDRATSTPVGCTSWAPRGKLRATSTQRLESGIHASTEGMPLLLLCPSICEATVADWSSVT